MNRREFLQCAAILVSGASVSQLGLALTEEQQAYLAAAPNYNTGSSSFFNESQRKIIAAMSEVVMPRTDTPGAIDAGVPGFVELMAADWFNDEERTIFLAGLVDIETRIPVEYGASFDQLDGAQQLEVMEALEDEASDSSWYDFANVQRDFISDAPFICQIKELSIWGFFTSEVGGSQVLRYSAMPMYFDGDVPLSPDDSSWLGRIG
ncbi:MAG: gluconate 2-dehydrogenase subunit 3 family protein [Halioglobus sp.]